MILREGGEFMNAITVGPVPPGYKKPVSEELRGEIKECTYPVRNYINRSRQLVTNQEISSAEAGRESVQGYVVVARLMGTMLSAIYLII